MLAALLRDIERLLLPWGCVVCRQTASAAEAGLCLACRAALPRTHTEANPGNPLERALWGLAPVQRVAALWHFIPGGGVQSLIHSLKYKNNRPVGRAAGVLLGQALANADANAKRGGWAKCHAVIPVPLHPKKLAARGYNQSQSIAEGVAAALQIPMCPGGLTRTRHTESQTRKTRTERAANVKDAFAVGLLPAGAKTVLVIDDVLTTGATLGACATALHAAGLTVWVATLASARTAELFTELVPDAPHSITEKAESFFPF